MCAYCVRVCRVWAGVCLSAADCFGRVLYLSSFDVRRQEFLCPLCQRLSNTVIPLVPDRTEPAPSPAATAAADHIGVWLSGLLVATGQVSDPPPSGHCWTGQ